MYIVMKYKIHLHSLLNREENVVYFLILLNAYVQVSDVFVNFTPHSGVLNRDQIFMKILPTHNKIFQKSWASINYFLI